MRIFLLAVISTSLCVTNTLAYHPARDQVSSLEYSALLELIKSQDKEVKLKAALFHQTEQAETLAMKYMRSSQDREFMLYAVVHLRNYLRGALGMGNVIETYEKEHTIKTCEKERSTDTEAELKPCEKEGLRDMESEIKKWSKQAVSPRQLWLLYRFMKTPTERHSFYFGKYHLNQYWASRLYFTPEIIGAATNYILGTDLNWYELKTITSRLRNENSPAKSWVDIERKEVKVGPKGRLQSLLDMSLNDWDDIRIQINNVIAGYILGFTSHQADELSKIFANYLGGPYPEKSPAFLEPPIDVDRIFPPHSDIPSFFCFYQLDLDQKVALRQLALVVETQWDAFKEIIIDPGYL
ncbi:hypothetical protein FRB94_005305 [Tulasnella sp. JGI-2019a]|nr:hypothetical protein FRB93_000500 [Tulasnella sp. JGI-2019a]KAG9000652.1 hypothetical protein FRB94_005305 [Tulasnella sp. JGI-2019a]KAG9029879.1 hypothetical protein FRB95_004755 [Tulasnella sp. JGI-2019a]